MATKIEDIKLKETKVEFDESKVTEETKKLVEEGFDKNGKGEDK